MASTFLGMPEASAAAGEGDLEKRHAKIGQLAVERVFFGEGLRSMSEERRRALVKPKHPELSVERRRTLVSVRRSAFYYQPTGESPFNLALTREIDDAGARGLVVVIDG